MTPFKQIVKITKVNPTSEMQSKVLDEALKLQRNRIQQSTPGTNIWRIIMTSKMTKFAVAAVIVIAALIGINHFGGSIDGTSVALADVIENMEKMPWLHYLFAEYGRRGVVIEYRIAGMLWRGKGYERY